MQREKTRLHANISPTKTNWVAAGAGAYGLTFAYVIRKDDGRVELYIDRGKGKDEENLSLFNALKADRQKIEETFGGPLDWQDLDGRRACRIAKKVGSGGYRDESSWLQAQADMIDAMVRLESAL